MAGNAELIGTFTATAQTLPQRNGAITPLNATDMGFGNYTIQLIPTSWSSGSIGFYCTTSDIPPSTTNICPLAMYDSSVNPNTFVTTVNFLGSTSHIYRTIDATGLLIYIVSAGTWVGSCAVWATPNAIL